MKICMCTSTKFGGHCLSSFGAFKQPNFPFWTIDYTCTDKVLTVRTIVASAPLNCPFNMPMHTINHLKCMLLCYMGYNGGIAMQHLASSPAVLQSQLHHLCPYCTRTHACFKYCISCKNTIIVTKIVIPQQLFEV